MFPSSVVDLDAGPLCERRSREPLKTRSSYHVREMRTRRQLAAGLEPALAGGRERRAGLSRPALLTVFSADSGHARARRCQGLVDLFQRRAAASRVVGLRRRCEQLFGEAVALAARGEQLGAGFVALGGAALQLRGETLGGLLRLSGLAAGGCELLGGRSGSRLLLAQLAGEP